MAYERRRTLPLRMTCTLVMRASNRATLERRAKRLRQRVKEATRAKTATARGRSPAAHKPNPSAEALVWCEVGKVARQLRSVLLRATRVDGSSGGGRRFRLLPP
jgi:hypothetical protein